MNKAQKIPRKWVWGEGGEEPIIASYKKLERKPNAHG